LNIFATAWNTEGLSKSEYPKTWEDVLTKYSGRIGMEAGDWDWMATLVEEYFVKEEGMSEDEAVDLFRKGIGGAQLVDGHTTMAQLLASGEYDITSSAYQHEIEQLADKGAPVEWQPPVFPIVERPNGIGIYRDTDCPATALLFVEYGITDAQQIIHDIHRTPANVTYQDSSTVTKKYADDVIPADLDHLSATRDKWEGLYEGIVEKSGGHVIEGE
jgi:iron(III) transport system substrate-binding protein